MATLKQEIRQAYGKYVPALIMAAFVLGICALIIIVSTRYGG